MKKRIGILTMLVLVFTLMSTTVFAEKDYINLEESGSTKSFERVTVDIDGREMTGDVPGVIYGTTTMVPVRFITEGLGGQVEWNQAKREVEIRVNSKLMYVKQDSKTVVVDGKTMQLDSDVTSPKALNQRIMIPLRFVSEEYGHQVEWDNVERSASVRTDRVGMTPDEDLNKIGDISKTIVDGREAIVIHNSSAVDYGSFKLDNPARLVLDIEKSEFEGSTKYEISDNIVKSVRTGEQDNNKKRIVFDMQSGASDYKYDIKTKGNNLIVTFESDKVGKYEVSQGSAELGEFYGLDLAITEAKKWANSKIILAGTVVWSFGEGNVDSSSPDPNEDNSTSTGNKTVVIDAGHGGSDPGAISVSGKREKDLVLNVSKYLKQELESRGYNVLMTRSTDVYPSLSDRVDFANEKNADIFISVHFNAATAAATGIETFAYSTDPNSEGYKLARAVHDELIDETGARDRGVKEGRFYVVRNTSMPAALLELGFITNPNDEKELISDSYHRRTAEATAIGIDKYFKNN